MNPKQVKRLRSPGANAMTALHTIKGLNVGGARRMLKRLIEAHPANQSAHRHLAHWHRQS
jgi:hypothetical protein